MVDQLSAFADEVTRVAREVGTQGNLGGQAVVRGVSGTWKDLTDNVNVMASNLTAQVRSIAQVATAVERGDLSQQITVEAKGEVAALAQTINRMVGTLSAFADEVTRVAREVGTEGRLGGQADVKGVAGHLEGPDRQRQLDGGQPDQPGPQHRPGHHRGRPGRPVEEDRRRGARRDPRAQDHHQHHGRPAVLVRGRGHPRRPRGGQRGPAGRPGRGRGRVRHLEAADGERERAGREPDQAGPRDRRGDQRGRRRRPDQVDLGGGPGRGRRAQGQHQRDGVVAARDDPGQPAAGLAEDQPGPHRGHDAGPPGPRHRRRADHGRARPAHRGPARHVLPDRADRRRRHPAAPHRRLRAAGRQDGADPVPARPVPDRPGGPEQAVDRGREPARGLRDDLLRPRRGAAREPGHRAHLVRGPGARGHRARLVHARSARCRPTSWSS